MLHFKMRLLMVLAAASLVSLAAGQVEVTGPIRFTGDPGSRTLNGLARPIDQGAAMTVEATLLGIANWAEATVSVDTVQLTPSVGLSSYRTGQLLRFVAPMSMCGALYLESTGLPGFPMLRPDGLPLACGQVTQGRICEVIFAGDRWVVLNASEIGCPPGTIHVNDRLCIESTPSALTLFYPAVDRCGSLGGKLCKWDEFLIACSLVGGQMNGLFANWEWIDDSSNHGHTSVQVGFGTCSAQRFATPPTYMGVTRCCFQPQ